MKDCRCPFDEALERLKGFLKSQNWSTDLLWLTRDRVAVFGREYFVFRPLELQSDAVSREHYEQIRKTEFNIHIDGLAQFEGHTLAYVQKEEGESSLLNFSIPGQVFKISEIKNSFLWKMILWRAKKDTSISVYKLDKITPEPVAAGQRR